MSNERRVDDVSGTETTGHEWDGIDELDTPMPRWWLGIFYISIVVGIIYAVFMPAIPALPGMQGYTKGVWGRSDRAIVAESMSELYAERAIHANQLIGANLTEINGDPDGLLRFAMAQGKSIFGDNCAICHGENGSGNVGYPSLADDVWLWGGSYGDIKQTITYGIRSDHDDARIGSMMAYGVDEMLTDGEIDTLVSYVLSLSDKNVNSASLTAGAELFADNCTACHADDGTGTRENGAPNLTDQEWLYGGDAATVKTTIFYGRNGLMPNWNERLREDQIAALAVYVHSLGGGE